MPIFEKHSETCNNPSRGFSVYQLSFGDAVYADIYWSLKAG